MVLFFYISGTILILTSGVIFIKYIRLKTLKFADQILNQELTFTVENYKLHSISFVGGKFIKIKKGLKINISDSAGNCIPVKKNWIKLRFSYKGHPAVETFYFYCPSGNYKLIVENLQDLELTKSKLPSEQMFGSPLNTNQIGLLIKEAMSDKLKFLIFLLLIFGLLLINAGWTLDGWL